MTCELETSVFSTGTSVFLARVVDAEKTAVTQASIASAAYTIYANPTNTSLGSAVTGHDDVSLDVSSVIFDTLQTDDLWETDGIGYNFKHTPSASSNFPFPNRGSEYILEYQLTPASGEIIIFRYKIYAI